MEKTDSETKKDSKNALSIPSAIVVAGVLISLAMVFASSPKSVEEKNAVASNTIPIPAVTEDDFIMGNSNAEITLVEYSDFSCSFCARYHPTMKKIVADYPGKVRWVYRHLPIFNKPAAVASQCVGNILGDKKFFEYADVLFDNQKDINAELLKREAIVLGITESQYDTCINDKDLNDKISRDFTTARVLAGFNATPYTVLINQEGEMYSFSGALPYEEVSALVESFLN